MGNLFLRSTKTVEAKPPTIDQTICDQFFSAISKFDTAYIHIAFNYLATRSGNDFELRHARLFLNTSEPKSSNFEFQSQNVRAGRYVVGNNSSKIALFFKELVGGSLSTPHGELKFKAPSDRHYIASFLPFHNDGLQSQTRYNVLSITGAPLKPLRQPDIDWEIKAAAQPYDGLQEIFSQLSLGGISDQNSTVELVAFNVASIDGQNSRVSGRKAEIRMRIASTLDKNQAAVTYRSYAPGEDAVRSIIYGSEMTWSETSELSEGQIEIDVSAASVVNCVATYRGIAQSHFWIADPDRSQNPRRAVYETFDPKLSGLTAIIENPTARGQDARQLEPAVSWILWQLGFSTMHLGGTPRTRDAADLLVGTPAGHFAVVECTTGLLKAENKLALLHSRAELVRKNLKDSGNKFQRVLPIIVTSRTLSEVKADIEAAERLGILVISRESLQEAILRTLLQPNADVIFNEGEQAVASALARHSNQPEEKREQI